MKVTLPLLLLVATSLAACSPYDRGLGAAAGWGSPVAPAPARPATGSVTTLATRAALTGTLGDQPVRIAIADGAVRVTLGDAAFTGTHTLFAVDGTIQAPGRADQVLSVRLQGSKLVGEIAGKPLTFAVRREAGGSRGRRLLDGTWGDDRRERRNVDRSFALAFDTAPDSKLQLSFTGTLAGLPAQIQGAGPWQGEQFAVYASLFALMAAAPWR